MAAPYEALGIKLAEIFERFVGGFASPWQIRRVGRAHIDVREEEVLRLAQADAEAEQIRTGKKQIIEGKVIALPAPNETVKTITSELKDEQHGDVQSFAIGAKAEADYLAIKRAINLRRIALLANDEAENTPDDTVSAAPIDPDWFARWREAAQDVSNEEMQQLWAKLLAGEAKTPGAFSLQTVALLRNLSKQQAEWIAALGAFSFGGWMYKHCDDILTKKGITLDVLYELEGLNVIGALDHIGGVQQPVNFDQNVTPIPTAFIGTNGHGLLFRHNAPAPTLNIPMYKILSAGKELISLGKFDLDRDYLLAVADFAIKQGYSVSFFSYTSVSSNQVRIISEQAIPDPPSHAETEQVTP